MGSSNSLSPFGGNNNSLRTNIFGAPDAYADMPEIDFDHHSEGGDTSGGETSDDDDHNGASGSGLDGAAASQEGPYAPPHLPPDTDIGSDGNPPAGAMLPAYTGIAPGTDTRGMGLESFPGRGKVRKRKGTTRPPTIPPSNGKGVAS